MPREQRRQQDKKKERKRNEEHKTCVCVSCSAIGAVHCASVVPFLSKQNMYKTRISPNKSSAVIPASPTTWPMPRYFYHCRRGATHIDEIRKFVQKKKKGGNDGTVLGLRKSRIKSWDLTFKNTAVSPQYTGLPSVTPSVNSRMNQKWANDFWCYGTFKRCVAGGARILRTYRVPAYMFIKWAELRLSFSCACRAAIRPVLSRGTEWRLMLDHAAEKPTSRTRYPCSASL